MKVLLLLAVVRLGSGQPCRATEDANLPECLAKYLSGDDQHQILQAGNGKGHDCTAYGMTMKDGKYTLDFARDWSWGERPYLSSLGKGECDSGRERIRGVSGVREVSWNGAQHQLIVSNGIPDHCYDVGQDFPNPNFVCENFRAILRPLVSRKNSAPPDYAWKYSRYYNVDWTYKPNGMGAVGIAVSGAFMFNHESAEASCTAAAISEKSNIDACDGHSNPQQMYHYHQVPNCIQGWDECGLLGWQKDGIPTYGYCNFDGQQARSCYAKLLGSNGCSINMYKFKDDILANESSLYSDVSACNLDRANGHEFTKATVAVGGQSFAAGEYAYFFTPEYPFIMPYTAGAYDAVAPLWCLLPVD